MAISFFNEETDFKLPHKIKHKNWLKQIANEYNYRIIELNYIFCTDEYLHQINMDYLKHDTYTDIITFDNSEKQNLLEGDIFISWDRVKDNATKNNVSENMELLRVMSHGLLHLVGYKDKTKEEKEEMRKLEDQCIQKFNLE
jgi:probable rRNA maturation factor